MQTSKSSNNQQFSHDQLVAEVDAQYFKNLRAARAEQEQARLQRIIASSGIPARYTTSTLETINRDYYPHAFEKIEKIMLSFDENLLSGSGLLIYGDVGVGKTMLACALCNSLIKRRYTAIYATFCDIVLNIKSTWKNDVTSEMEIYQALSKPDLLVIDEVGVQHDTDFERVISSNVIDRRSRDLKPTILISNHKPNDVLKMIGKRAFDRVIGFGGAIIEMKGKSLR